MRTHSCTGFSRIANFFSHLRSNVRDSFSKIMRVFKANVFRHKKSDQTACRNFKLTKDLSNVSPKTGVITTASISIAGKSEMQPEMQPEKIIKQAIASSQFVVTPDELKKGMKDLDDFFKLSFINTPIDQLVEDLSRDKHEIEWLSLGSCYLNWIQYQISACDEKNLEQMLKNIGLLIYYFKEQNNEFLFVGSIGPLSQIIEVRKLVFKYKVMTIDEAKKLQSNCVSFVSSEEINKPRICSRLPNLAYYNVKLDEISKGKKELNYWLISKDCKKDPEKIEIEIKQRDNDIQTLKDRLSGIQIALRSDLKGQSASPKDTSSIIKSLLAFREAMDKIPPVERNNILRAEIKEKLKPLLED